MNGDHAVPPNESQDTHAASPGTACDNAEFTRDMAIGREVARGFAVAGFAASADLLEHFLAGQGTEVDYRPGGVVIHVAATTRP